MRIVVLGGGAWGTAFATVLREHGHDVSLAFRDPAQAEATAAAGINERYLPGIRLGGHRAHDLRRAPISRAPSSSSSPSRAGALPRSSRELPGDAPILSLTKGLDPATGGRLSELVRDRPFAVLSGPNIADEVARGLPAAAVIACESMPLAVQLQLAITSPTFRVYASDDLAGVELCAAAKNVIALAAGGADGLELGDNTKAALVARGLAEMARLAEGVGAKPETFSGLAGMGDLIVTCWSKSGRNRRCGELVAQGMTPDAAVAAIGHVVEGLTTAHRCCVSSAIGSTSSSRSRRASARCSTASRSPSWRGTLMQRDPTVE